MNCASPTNKSVLSRRSFAGFVAEYLPYLNLLDRKFAAHLGPFKESAVHIGQTLFQSGKNHPASSLYVTPALGALRREVLFLKRVQF